MREQTYPALKRWAILVLSLRDALLPDSPEGATEHSPVFQHRGKDGRKRNLAANKRIVYTKLILIIKQETPDVKKHIIQSR
jgi:hypothetical protein